MRDRIEEMTERNALSDAKVFDDRPLVQDFDLRDLRHQNPFWEIFPWPNSVQGVNLGDTVPVDVPLVSGTQAIRIKAQNGKDVLVNIRGSAQQIPASSTDFSGCAPILNPEGWFYVGSGITSISVSTPSAPCMVSVECFVQL